MNNPVIKIISATKHESPNRYQNIPRKKRVLGYAWGMKGAGRGVQIRKNIRRLIKDYTDWELIEVCTDYCKTESHEMT